MSTKSALLSRRGLLRSIPGPMRYRLFLGATLLMATILIGLLSVVLIHSGPRVRHVEFNSTKRLTVGSSVVVVFDRPLKDQDYSAAVSFEPSIAFSSKVRGKSIVLTLDSNMSQATTYTLKINPDVYDQNGNKMKKGHEQEFTTSNARYAYLQRNYSLDIATGNEADDIVFLEDISGKSERLFAASRIRAFRINDQFAVIATDEEGSDAIYTVNLKTRDIKKETLYINGKIREIALSPEGSVVLYTVEPDYNPDDPQSFEKYAYQLRALDIKTGENYLLTDDKKEAIRAETVQLSNDGQYVLAKNLQGSYLVVSPFNDYDPVLLGVHTRSYGFDVRTQYIVFEDDGVVSTYQLSDSSLQERANDDVLLDLSAGKGDLFTQVVDYQTADLVTKIKRKKDWQASAVDVWESKDSREIVRSFNESYDQRYLGLSIMPNSCQFDDYDTASECEEASILMYDIEKQSMVRTISGFGLVWLP